MKVDQKIVSLFPNHPSSVSEGLIEAHEFQSQFHSIKAMSTKYIAIALFSILTSAIGFGGDLFPAQPAISTAYSRLLAAQRQVEQSRTDKYRKKPLSEASINLTTATTSLEEAKKNKGPHRSAAIKLIAQAKTEVEASKENPARTDQAATYIKEAIERVVKAGETGRR